MKKRKGIQLVHKDCEGELVLAVMQDNDELVVACKKCSQTFTLSVPTRIPEDFTPTTSI